MTAELPKMFRVGQHFPGHQLADPAAAVTAELERIRLQDRVRRGQTVGIAVGSRGVANLAAIVSAVVRHVKAVGGIPLILPAMGSHGGGTSEGQRGVLAALEIDEATMGCEIRASMETVVLG